MENKDILNCHNTIPPHQKLLSYNKWKQRSQVSNSYQKTNRILHSQKGSAVLTMFMPTEQHHHAPPSNIESGPLLPGLRHQPNASLLRSRPHRPPYTPPHTSAGKQKQETETKKTRKQKYRRRGFNLRSNPGVFLLHVVGVRAIVSFCSYKTFPQQLLRQPKLGLTSFSIFLTPRFVSPLASQAHESVSFIFLLTSKRKIFSQRNLMMPGLFFPGSYSIPPL